MIENTSEAFCISSRSEKYVKEDELISVTLKPDTIYAVDDLGTNKSKYLDIRFCINNVSGTVAYRYM